MMGKSSVPFANGEDGKRRYKMLVEAMSIKTSERLLPGLIQVGTLILDYIILSETQKTKKK